MYLLFKFQKGFCIFLKELQNKCSFVTKYWQQHIYSYVQVVYKKMSTDFTG